MKISLFPALFDRPSCMKFADQEENEVIELFLRQHWVTNVPWIVTILIGSFFPALLLRVNQSLGVVDLSQIPANILLAITILWYLLLLIYAIEKFLFWYFNVYIVTNIHLVDIDFQNLQSTDKTEVRLEDVESARSRFRGILGPLFNFGDVIVETAAEKQNIEFLSVPRPDFVRERIQDLQEMKTGGKHAR